MTTKRLPWKLRPADFNSPGWHTRPTIAYELLFEYLRLSPSYELARKEAVEELTQSERASLPVDFDEVRATYALLGDVQEVLFRTWWLEKGLKAFGRPGSRPAVRELAAIPDGVDAALAQIGPAIERYLEEQRRDEGLGASLLIALPLGARTSDALKQVRALLNKHSDTRSTVCEPALRLHGQRLRSKALFSGIRLLWIRAAKPKWELWRLGAKARISSTYSSVLNPDAPRRVADEQEMIDREMMSKITYRALLKFEAIAENAARGRFPLDQPVLKATFDYPELAKRIQRKNKWESREKARLMKAMETRDAKRQSEPPGL